MNDAWWFYHCGAPSIDFAAYGSRAGSRMGVGSYVFSLIWKRETYAPLSLTMFCGFASLPPPVTLKRQLHKSTRTSYLANSTRRSAFSTLPHPPVLPIPATPRVFALARECCATERFMSEPGPIASASFSLSETKEQYLRWSRTFHMPLTCIDGHQVLSDGCRSTDELVSAWKARKRSKRFTRRIFQSCWVSRRDHPAERKSGACIPRC